MRQDELDRRRELLTVTELAIDAWLYWQQQDRDALIVPESLRQAWVDMVTVWADGSIPADCRELARAVDRFDADHLTPWLGEMDRSNKQAILPPNAFWAALEAISSHLLAVTTPAMKPLEPIKDLVAQGVSPTQIAKIYGFKDVRGNWSEAMVREELAKPGTHTGEGWVDPRLQRKIDRQTARAEAVGRAREVVARKIARREAQPKESLQELIEQGVSLDQIVKIFRTTPDDILAQCRAEGLPEPAAAPPGTSMASIYATDAEVERGEAFVRQAGQAGRHTEEVIEGDEGDESGDDAEPQASSQTLEQQIVACHLQGLGVEETVQALQHLEGAGPRKVKAVVKRYQENPEAFGMAERVPAGR